MTEVSFTMYWLCLLWRDTDIIRLLSLAGRLNSLGTTLGGTRWWSEQRAASVGRAFLQKHDWERTNTEMWWCLISTDDASVWNARRVIRWHDRGLFVVFVACNDHRAAACLSVCLSAVIHVEEKSKAEVGGGHSAAVWCPPLSLRSKELTERWVCPFSCCEWRDHLSYPSTLPVARPGSRAGRWLLLTACHFFNAITTDKNRKKKKKNNNNSFHSSSSSAASFYLCFIPADFFCFGCWIRSDDF